MSRLKKDFSSFFFFNLLIEREAIMWTNWKERSQLCTKRMWDDSSGSLPHTVIHIVIVESHEEAQNSDEDDNVSSYHQTSRTPKNL